MVGASKINNTTNDLDRLYELFDLGLNNSEIARVYRTNSGASLSRIHISSIRRGKRWNLDTRSFIMKDELLNQDTITTTYKGKVIKTCISQLITDGEMYYVYTTYMDGKPSMHVETSLMVRKPSNKDLIQYHIKLLNGVKGENTES